MSVRLFVLTCHSGYHWNDLVAFRIGDVYENLSMNFRFGYIHTYLRTYFFTYCMEQSSS